MQGDNIIFINFADNKIPEFKDVRNKPWVFYGENDDYPDHLLMLYNKSAKHNAIICGKKNYIFGDGFTIKDEANADAQAWKLNANTSGESLNDIAEKSILDIEVYGGFYWQIIKNLAGDIAEIYHLDFTHVRSNKDNTEFYYKRDWKDKKEELKCFPAFDPKLTETSIFYFREYRPGLKTYSLPGYVGSSNYIESDVEISKHTLTNAKTGFSASKFINFYNGEPDEDKKRSIERRFNDKFTGSEGKKILIGFNNDPSKKPTIDDLGASDITKEDFGHVDAIITQNIYSGHQITSPLLFGIQEPGKLGAHNELRLAFEIFKNTYVQAKQKQFENIINYFATIKGITTEFKLIPVDPVGIEFGDATLLQAAPRSWLLEKMGIDPNKYTDAPIGSKSDAGALPPAAQPNLLPEQQMVNDNIKNLTGRQHQQLLRVIRQYSKGQMTKEAACTLLRTSLGLGDKEIYALLGIEGEFSSQYSEEDIADMFSEVGQRREVFEVIRSKPVQFTSSIEAMEYELNFFQQHAEDFKDVVSSIEGSVLSMVKKDKRIAPQTIADSLGIDEAAVQEALKNLESKGFLKSAEIIENGEKVLVRTVTKEFPSLIRTVKSELPEIFIRYSYEVKPGVGAAVIPGTRPFCKKLVQLDRLYSRVEIEQISERVGYSVWDRRGGFWNNNGEVSPSCRHVWKSNVVIKKRKG